MWWLVEGEGFGGDDGHVSDEEEVEEEEQMLESEALEGEGEAAGYAVSRTVRQQQSIWAVN